MISLIALVTSLAILALTPDSIPTLHSQTMTGMLYLHEVRLMRSLFFRNVAVRDCTAAPSLAWKCHDIEPQPAQCTGHRLDLVTGRAGQAQSHRFLNGGLRHFSPLQSGALCRQEARRATLLRPDCVWDPWRDRNAP